MIFGVRDDSIPSILFGEAGKLRVYALEMLSELEPLLELLQTGVMLWVVFAAEPDELGMV